MLGIVITVLAILAMFSWVLAVYSAVRIVSLTPRGTRWRNYFRLGWWKFGEIEADAGPGIRPHVQTYQRAFGAFFAIVVIMAIASAFAGAAAT